MHRVSDMISIIFLYSSLPY